MFINNVANTQLHDQLVRTPVDLFSALNDIAVNAGTTIAYGLGQTKLEAIRDLLKLVEGNNKRYHVRVREAAQEIEKALATTGGGPHNNEVPE